MGTESETVVTPDVLMKLPPGVRLDNYVGVWAMEPTRFQQMCAMVRSIDLSEHVTRQTATSTSTTKGKGCKMQSAAPGGRTEPVGLGDFWDVTESGVAVVQLRGVMTKRGSSLSSWPGNVRVKQALRAMRKEDRVRGVVMVLESGGGASMGVGDLADELWSLRAEKPTSVYFEDVGASAAYFVGCQAETLCANEDAIVGSIGTFMIIDDVSEANRKRGIVTHVIRAGEFKGAGEPGTELTEAQRAEFQRVVDDINSRFTARVMRSRGFNPETMQVLADGRVHLASEAVKLKLIDRVGTFDDVMAAMETRLKSPRPMRPAAIPEPSGTSSGAATWAELKAAFPNADADFRAKCLDGEFSIEEARSAYCQSLEDQIEAANKSAAESREACERAERKAVAISAGTEPIGGAAPSCSVSDEEDGDMYEGDAVAEFHTRVQREVDQGVKRLDAIERVVKRDPELHQAYLLATNGPGAANLIRTKFQGR